MPTSPAPDDTGEIRLPSAAATYAPTPHIVTLSGMLTIALMAAALTTVATVGAAGAELIQGTPAVTDTVMLLLCVGMAVSWTSVVHLVSRDDLLRGMTALRADHDRTQARVVDLGRHCDHLSALLTAMVSRQHDDAGLLTQLAGDVAAIRSDVRDALEVADVDAELTLRRELAPAPATRPRLIKRT